MFEQHLFGMTHKWEVSTKELHSLHGLSLDKESSVARVVRWMRGRVEWCGGGVGNYFNESMSS